MMRPARFQQQLERSPRLSKKNVQCAATGGDVCASTKRPRAHSVALGNDG
eukprot:CAMPEP_0176142774 /NCGR_PEP_ID=MMETSP0120_2-20121206/72653_1 /TAXON_ID=160619 /ORGANISM="Kryptoperidinium foliaceum, Strain CCMP 1326" /LENGTH=49 /DNA_ID= /DNA_START= /DNA_END= /DNA_ORIENTATION=